MIYCIDIDETLCHSIEDDYAHSEPCKEAITKVNKLFDDGHYIKLFTGRGSWDETDWTSFTKKQLEKWGIKYNELIMGKPHADVFIDDKALNARDWMELNNTTKEVSRDWGREYWIINCDEYCSKLLFIAKGAKSGDHYHQIKKETFYCLRGQILLTINNVEILFDQFSKPITIMPNDIHSFRGQSNAIILEVSTHHSDDDVIFLSEGFKKLKAGVEDAECI